uniref:DNA-directed RNA polymerase subunit beta n=1 Tax=Euglena mutabilis TaxID=38275 RepID=A0A1B0UKY4_EUGMU|nr:RNA polymerase beta subunit [Euglena mutabilis]
MDENKYDLTKIGREKIDKKLYKKVFWSKQTTLKPEDLLGSVNILLKIKNGKKDTDEVDSLKNKKIRNSGELLKNQIKNSIYELSKDIKDNLKVIEEKIKKNKNLKININEIVNNQILTNIIISFFIKNPLSQIMEETNPLAEITQKRKISSFGIGAIDKKRTNLDMREINISYFGRICPIETTEGKNAGLILSLAKETRINEDGFLETPVHTILKNVVQKKKGLFFITYEQEKNMSLIPSDILVGKKNKIMYEKNKKIYTKQGGSFTYKKIKKAKFIHTKTSQIISIGTNLIPFLEHDDANRALMGSNMQRQALAVKKKEKPTIETGIEIEIGKNSESTIKARKTSFVEFVSIKKIITKYFNEPYDNFKTNSLKKKLKKRSSLLPVKRNFKRKIYILDENRKSSQNTFVKQQANVSTGEYIKKGQVIADSVGTHQGKLSLGKNILVGYISWEGYNFEDAIVISKKLIDENTFTSFHLKKYKTFIITSENEEEKITNLLPNVSIKTIKTLKKNGIIQVGSKIENEEIIIGKIKEKKEKTFLNKILNSIFERDFIKDTSLKITKGNSGIITKIVIRKKRKMSIITVYMTEERKIEVGDKIAGRHGNKGIVSKILPVEDMPFLQDGTPIDMILNPLGIPSRMNVGQILECLLTLAGENLKENYKIYPFDEMQKNEMSKVLIYNKLYEAKEKTKQKWLFNTKTPGKTIVLDGRNGLPFQQPILVGYSYMLKLMHLVKDKINVRLTGPYSLILKQPLRGKCRNGGQRFGEMEVWALEGFGAAYILQEMLTIKSDDLTNRSKLLFSVINNNEFAEPGVPESLKILFIEIQSMLIELRFIGKTKNKLKD